MREPALSEIRDFVTRRLLNLRGLLRENVPRAKRELLEHVQQITLTPVQNMTAYAVSGSWELLPTGNDVISMVARDGVEPPTPAFSGLYSLSLNPFSINNLIHQGGPFIVTTL